MASQKKKVKPKQDIAQLITAHFRARELGRRHYAKSDRLLEQIRQQMSVAEEIALPGGKVAVLKDNFLGVNKVFRSHGISRFELEITQA